MNQKGTKPELNRIEERTFIRINLKPSPLTKIITLDTLTHLAPQSQSHVLRAITNIKSKTQSGLGYKISETEIQ